MFFLFCSSTSQENTLKYTTTTFSRIKLNVVIKNAGKLEIGSCALVFSLNNRDATSFLFRVLIVSVLKTESDFLSSVFSLFHSVFKGTLRYILKQTMLALYSTFPFPPTPFRLCDSRHCVTSALTRHW